MSFLVWLPSASMVSWRARSRRLMVREEPVVEREKVSFARRKAERKTLRLKLNAELAAREMSSKLMSWPVWGR